MQNLAGKVAVVTGAASGIGLALSRRLGADRMRVMMADVDEPVLATAAQNLAAEGIETASMVTDVSDADSVDALAQATVERFGAVHVICNNAGVSHSAPTWEIPLPTWNWTVGVNLFGVVHGIRSFVPRLISQREGHIVNTASMAGLLSPAWMSAYSATKHAAVAISETLYRDLAALGSPVGVSVLCPGAVRTNIHESFSKWPARYGRRPVVEDGPEIANWRQGMGAKIESGLDPAVVATAVRDAIVGNRFWILTHPEMADAVVDRYNGVAIGRNPR
jgi:NAD(P)-dependent dehydrogenase (short-subunit alcohol dehydrogenase family)